MKILCPAACELARSLSHTQITKHTKLSGDRQHRGGCTLNILMVRVSLCNRRRARSTLVIIFSFLISRSAPLCFIYSCDRFRNTGSNQWYCLRLMRFFEILLSRGCKIFCLISFKSSHLNARRQTNLMK
jgi:hypothetical protein